MTDSNSITSEERKNGSDGDADRRYVGALMKVANILAGLEREGSLSASELAAELQVDRSTAYRLAQALTKLDWVRQDPETKRYRLGYRLWELGARAVGDINVRTLAVPRMREVVAATGESCALAILDLDSVVYIDCVDGTREVRANTHIGDRQPAHAVAMGKVLLTYLTEEERAERLHLPLKRYTSQTLGSLEELTRACNLVRKNGYAVNLGELSLEAGAVAAPIFNHQGECAASVGVIFPLARLTKKYVRELAAALIPFAAEISKDMGGSAGQLLN